MVKRGLILGGVLAIISLASFSYVYADTTGSTKFSVDVENTVLELTIPATPAVIDLNPTMTGVSFGSTSINVKVATNNITGYQLTMTPTNSQTNTSLIRTELVGSESTYREIETLDLTDPVSTGYPEEDFTANKWGYKITGDNYYGIDPNNATVSHPSWTTSEPTNGTNHNLTLAAKVDASTVSGSYETTLNFRAVTNAVVAKDTVTFNGNGADSGDMSGDIVVASYGTPEILPANRFSRSGYHFIGWNTKMDGTGLSYADEGEYNPVSSDYNHNIILYAMWSNLPEGASTSGTTPSGNPGVTISRAYEIAYTAAHKGMWEKNETGEGYTQATDGIYHNRDVRWDMQGMTPEICNSVTAMHDDYQALDIRDWKLYHITKLKDGRCWMTQNLDFDIPTTALSSLDTDLVQYDVGGYTSAGGYTQSNGVIYWTPYRATSSSMDTFGFYDYSNRPLPVSFDPGDYYWIGNWNDNGTDTFYMPLENKYLYGDLGSDPEKFSTSPFRGNGMHGHVGNYYNWAAAIASNDANKYNSYYGPNGDGITLSDVSFNPQNSVCPRGWRIPTISTGGFTDEYTRLIEQYEQIGAAAFYENREKALAAAPLWFVRSGRIGGNGSELSESGRLALLWSSTTSARTTLGSAYYMSYFFTSGSTNSINGMAYRYVGMAIRCIAR